MEVTPDIDLDSMKYKGSLIVGYIFVVHTPILGSLKRERFSLYFCLLHCLSIILLFMVLSLCVYICLPHYHFLEIQFIFLPFTLPMFNYISISW